MRINFFALLIFWLSVPVVAQDTLQREEEIKIGPYVEGTLLKPTAEKESSLVILVPGSGPVNRDGNQTFMKNDLFKKLAQDLADAGIATYRFDKRILNMPSSTKEEDIRFDDFIYDVSSILDHFKAQDIFKNIVVLGHSQGSLVGMIAAREKADAFISVAGAGSTVDTLITEQIAGQMPGLKENVQQTFRELRQTGRSTQYSPMLEMIFRPSVQPFIVSWMQYNPKEELQKLEIPILLINGNQDLQVKPKEARKLLKAQPDSQLVLLDGMNHVMRKTEGDALENSQSYNDPELPLHRGLIAPIVNFINALP